MLRFENYSAGLAGSDIQLVGDTEGSTVEVDDLLDVLITT